MVEDSGKKTVDGNICPTSEVFRQMLPGVTSKAKLKQGWNSDFGLDKEWKKDTRQGKKDSWQGFNKSA